MIIDLRDIVDVPGSSVEFDYTPDISILFSDFIIGPHSQPRVYGAIFNKSGKLFLEATALVALNCTCTSCLTKIIIDAPSEIEVQLSTSESAIEDPDYYFISSNQANLDDIIPTELLLSLDQVQLCKEDCLGLCPGCGVDLNDDDCKCKPEIDPRLAVLSQLLEKQDD